ncbi:protein FAM217B isoform X2 [Denticeps clupeoides]|nr:protein FAM217B-like isoform X2 [Denticeps clupeoides]
MDALSNPPKSNSSTPLRSEVKERHSRPKSQRKGNKDSANGGPRSGRCSQLVSFKMRPETRRGSPEGETQKGSGKSNEDTDSGSDLSDSERLSGLPAPSAPPQLNLRAEVIDLADLQPPSTGSRTQGRVSKSYPDFLPPPFNAWSLRQLAVFLNTEGKGVLRPKPIGQLEKYLERLLQLEWRQIQTVREESGGRADVELLARRHRPHGPSSSSSLSSPKCILQCQRAFPLTLLSSITNTPPIQLLSCTCPNCRSRYPLCSFACRSYSHAHHLHPRPSPLLKQRTPPPALPKRSSSESRAQATERCGLSRGHRTSGLNGSSHMRRMQAAGNIRNPSLSPVRHSHPALSGMDHAVDVGGPCRGGRDTGARRTGVTGAINTQQPAQCKSSTTAKAPRKAKRAELVTECRNKVPQ